MVRTGNSLFPVSVVFLDGGRGQRVRLDHARNVGQLMLHPIDGVGVVVGFVPDAVVPVAEDVGHIPHVDACVRFLR